MYDLCGLYYEMKSESLIFGAIGLLFLVCGRFWAQKKNVKDLLLGMVCCILCVCSLVYYAYVINDLQISVHEGYFIEEGRDGRYLFRKDYIFSNDGETKPRFFLDVFSKNNIYPDEFEKGKLYRIYYEERTDIIVKIEKLVKTRF